MTTWKVNITNNTGTGPGKPLTTNVMVFQVNQELTTDSFSTAWKVVKLEPGATAGPIPIPVEIEFAVIYKDDDIPMTSPLRPIKDGQTALITQLTAGDVPKVEISGKPDPKGEVTATISPSTVNPLEVGLYKNKAKLISFKGVNPGEAVKLKVTPNIYLANNEAYVEGQDFHAAVQAAEATKFPLFPSKPDMHISVERKASGEVFFKLL